MKKKAIVFVTVLGITAVLAVLLFSPGRLPEEFAVKQKQALMAARGLPDDPDARHNWEMRRLVDPATGKLPENIRAKELAFAQTLPTKESRRMLGKPSDAAVFTWSQRGPNNVGGRTRALGMDKRNQSIILAGGVSGDMWRSTNGGSSWTITSDPSVVHSITCLAQDTRSGHEDTWYYGTGEYRGNSANGGISGLTGDAWFNGDGLFKSTNNGVSWTQMISYGTPQGFWVGDWFKYIWNIVTDPSNTTQDELYAATYGTISRSTDGGSNWFYVRGGSSPYSAYTDVAVTTTGVVYATLNSGGGHQGIWRSTDGTSWTNITPSGWPSTYRRTVIGIAPSNQNIVYFLSNTDGYGLNDHSFWKYTYVSGDGSGAGGTWEDRSAYLPAYGGYVGDYDSQSSYNMLVKVKPDDPDVVFIGGTNLYRSNNGFATSGNTAWIGGYDVANDISTYTNHWVDQHALVFYSTPTQMLVGCDGGVFKSANNMAGFAQDGVHTWTTLNNGYMTTQFYTVAVDHASSYNAAIIGGMQDNGTYYTRSTNLATPWMFITSGDGCYCAISDGGSHYYSSGQYAWMWRDDFNASGNWTGFARIDPSGGSDYMFVAPFAMDPNNTNRMYLAEADHLWRNSDLTAISLYNQYPTSTNWTELNNSAVSGYVSAVAVSRTPANRVYYGGDIGWVRRLDSANTGDPSPTDISTGKGLPTAYVSCIAVDPQDGDKVLLVFSNYSVKSLFYTTNGGSTWTDVSGNLEQFASGSGNGPSCRWGSILPYGGTTYYFVGTSTGLYSTTLLNGTSTVWVQEAATTIGNVVVDMMDVRESDGLVVAGTHGKGVYSTTIATAVEEPISQVPADFVLEQNYPNPFNPSTSIRFALPSPQHVVLKIYDARGREVAKLVDERRDAGRHEVQFDAGSLPSGVYICRIQAGRFSDTKKMNFVK